MLIINLYVILRNYISVRIKILIYISEDKLIRDDKNLIILYDFFTLWYNCHFNITFVRALPQISF